MACCTRAITGSTYPAFQSIFVCETCHPSEDALPKCICESCADVCHGGHDVTFVGVGPCTCDCDGNAGDDYDIGGGVLVAGGEGQVCLLANKSTIEARRLGFVAPGVLNMPLPPPVSSPDIRKAMADDDVNDNDDNASIDLAHL